MSTDASVTKDLLQTLEDGKAGFAKGAEKLTDSDSPELAATFRKYSEERAGFIAELEELAKTYGDDIEESGTVTGTLHRGWLAVKDALAGADPSGVLDAAEQGEDHAVTVYEKALTEDLSAGLREVVVRQATAVQAAHDDVRALRDTLG